jgi:uncharacterized Zn finger protein
MSRETAATKAVRYLAEGRLTVLRVAGDDVQAVCKGDGEIYRLGHDLRGGWFCNCPARTDGCCHLIALRAVTVRRSGHD